MKKIFMLLACVCIYAWVPSNLKAGPDYEGEGYIDAQSEYPRFNSFVFRPLTKTWAARSIGIGEEDGRQVQAVLADQQSTKRVYMPNPDDLNSISSWQKRVNERQPIYRPFLIENEAQIPLAIVELHTMPRAVSYPVEQDEILKYYQAKGLMTYDADNSEEPYFGKYRPVNDGKSSMVRMRFMPTEKLLNDQEMMTDMIKGTSAFIRKLFDQNYPMHTYPTDKEQGIPCLLMSYTALENSVRGAYKAAGFSLEENSVFKEFWPEEDRGKLPNEMIVATKFIHTIDTDLMEFRIQ